MLQLGKKLLEVIFLIKGGGCVWYDTNGINGGAGCWNSGVNQSLTLDDKCER